MGDSKFMFNQANLTNHLKRLHPTTRKRIQSLG
jgi:hypothetical protein